MMIEDLEKLNKRFYALFGDLRENSDLLPADQREIMAKRLQELYKKEYGLLDLRASVERVREEYALKLRYDALAPRSWRFLGIFKRKYNRAAQIIGIEVMDEVDQEFEARELNLKKAAERRTGQIQMDAELVTGMLRWFAAMSGIRPLLPLQTAEAVEAGDEPGHGAETAQGPQRNAEHGEDGDGRSSV